MLLVVVVAIEQSRIRVVGRPRPDPAQTPITSVYQSFQRILRCGPALKIGSGNDALTNLGLAKKAARAHGRDPVGILHLADGLELFGPPCAIHEVILDVDGGKYVMA